MTFVPTVEDYVDPEVGVLPALPMTDYQAACLAEDYDMRCAIDAVFPPVLIESEQAA